MADAKRRSADVLGPGRDDGEGFAGFLALVGAFDDASEFVDAMGDAVNDRGSQESRAAPLLDE
ncbi:MAG TPA: hypothetical protein VG165_06045 [Solirubrobacteraceae bacterium]|nr:hypothetical protein [Solirubrobacteraceae bacterium]